MLEKYSYDDTGDNITGINCHCCTHVYLREEKRWILVDPSFNAFFTDRQSKILNIIEIKDTLKRKQPVILARYTLNGHDDIFRKGYPFNFIFNMSYRISVWDGNLKSKRLYNKNVLYPEVIDKQKLYIMKQRANGASEDEINSSLPFVKYISVDELLSAPDL